jgi:hypothetical protein
MAAFRVSVKGGSLIIGFFHTGYDTMVDMVSKIYRAFFSSYMLLVVMPRIEGFT